MRFPHADIFIATKRNNTFFFKKKVGELSHEVFYKMRSSAATRR
jgi:hypothetical protein